jgi:hypothetical protein
MGSGRIAVAAGELPVCVSVIPRPGDRVGWYDEAIRYRGELIGHHADGSPSVRCADTAATLRVPDFDVLSFEDPDDRAGPNWTRLGPGAVIERPTAHETRVFDELLQRCFVSGTRRRDLLTEIRRHGHEVFVTGGTVRDVLLGSPQQHDLDLVTTMPLIRLATIGRRMCTEWPELNDLILRNGRHTVGDIPDGVHLDIAVFKLACPGSAMAIFGSDMTHDIRFRDFSVNALFLDPLDNVLYDPTGLGLADIAGRVLRSVGELQMRSARQLAKLCIRAVRFCAEGLQPDPSTSAQIRGLLTGGTLDALNTRDRLAFFEAQVVRPVPTDQRADRLKAARSAFETFEAATVWDRYFADKEAMWLS